MTNTWKKLSEKCLDNKNVQHSSSFTWYNQVCDIQSTKLRIKCTKCEILVTSFASIISVHARSTLTDNARSVALLNRSFVAFSACESLPSLYRRKGNMKIRRLQNCWIFIFMDCSIRALHFYSSLRYNFTSAVSPSSVRARRLGSKRVPGQPQSLLLTARFASLSRRLLPARLSSPPETVHPPLNPGIFEFHIPRSARSPWTAPSYSLRAPCATPADQPTRPALYYA